MPEQTPNQQELKKKRNKELFAYFRQIVKKEGFFAALSRTWRYLRRRHTSKRGRFLPTAEELQRQRDDDVTGWVTVSLCVPAFNPDGIYFKELLDSVVGQSYPNWELCIADASDSPDNLRQLVEGYEDERIKLEKVTNEGISENTNRAAQLASGQYLAFADHDDILAPNALYEIARRVAQTGADFMYSDEALFTDDFRNPTVGHFKPDYSPQYLLNVNYMAHLAAVKREVFQQLGGFRKECDGAQDHDLYLRVLEVTGGAEHIQKVLYYWRQHPGSTSTGIEAKPYVTEAAIKAIDDHLERIGVWGKAKEGRFASTYKVDYDIRGLPKISIIIPSCDHIEDLERCVSSIYAKSQYRNFEVVVVENNSHKVETFAYYQKLQDTHPECRVVVYEGGEGEGFNFSRVCNFGRQNAKGDYFLFLNNDTEVINREWLFEMLQLCQLQNVGAVGAMLYYPDDTVQHAGVIVGLGGHAGHSHKYSRRGTSGYMFRKGCVQELSAVTGACMMVPKHVFDRMGGFDEGFSVAYNDVDLCLRMRENGWWVLFTPYAQLYHYESKSRGSDEEGAAQLRFAKEKERLRQLHEAILENDPFYNPYLTKDREDFSENDVTPEV